MLVIYQFLRKIRAIRPLYLQILLVALAFILMVVSSRVFVSNILRNYLSKDAIDTLTQTTLKIESELIEHETSLTVISTTIREMILQGYNADQIREYMKNIFIAMENKVKGFLINDLYGYFDVFDGQFFDSLGWDFPEDHMPAERPWYKTAVEAGDVIAITPMYMNLRVSDYIITYVRRIFDEQGVPLAIICMDVSLADIRNHVANMRLTENGYGIFINEKMELFYFPESEMIGKSALEISSDPSALVNEALAGNSIFEREIINYKNKLAVAFSSQLYNGWLLFILTPKEEYYRELHEMEIFLIVLGIVLALALIAVLIRVDLSKEKLDKENRQKDILLATMEKEREADELTQLILDAMPFSCLLWDKDLNNSSCNEAAVKLFKLSGKQDYIDRFHDLSPEYQPNGAPSRETALEKVKKAFETGYDRFEWMHQTMTGEPLPAEITLVRAKYKGGYIVVAYSRDLRELKAMLNEMHKVENDLRLARDAAEVANITKSAFLANMSHEIRTPMNSIIGFTELAMDDTISPQTKDYLQHIIENAEWLLLIINDILDISKVESGKMDLEHIPFDPHEILAHCQTLIMQKAMEKGIQLHFYAEPSVGRKLLGDPTRLRQILINLLSNAVKFTNIGMVKLSSTITDLTENTVTIQFEIKDSGIGMTPEQMERIFEPFMQADSTTTRKYGGTGLGLSITKNLIELMGGKLIVESTVGLGSKFCFSLTFDTINISVDKKNDNEFTDTTWVEKPVFEGEILVCEDNIMNQRVIREYLSKVGLKTVIAENGKEGVETVLSRKENGKKPFDLIFMDIHMPIMDGLEAASKINEMQTGTPIVAMTADIMSNDKELYRQSGMPDHVGKPFTSQELWRCLLRYLVPINKGEKQNNVPLESDMELQKVLQLLFAKNNQKKFNEITMSLEAGDIKLAHRLAHTLKGNAGQIGMLDLQLAATNVEQALKNGKNMVTEEQLKTLGTELNAVLDELAPLLDSESADPPAQPSVPVPELKANSSFEKLEPLLKSGNPDCLGLISDLKTIPGCERLIRQMEDFDFEAAFSTLVEINKDR